MPRGRGRLTKNIKQVEETEPESAAEEEYEVERVESHQIKGKGKNAKLQYLVKWKNYPDSDNTWEPASAVENAEELVNDYWATQGGEKVREEVFKQLQGSKKTPAATKDKKEATVSAPAAEEEEHIVESRKRKSARGTAASPSPTTTSTATNSRKKRAKLDTLAAEDAKPKETEDETEDESDISDSEVEGETFRLNQKWDGKVQKVQFVRRDEDDDQLYAIVRWNDSKLAKYKTSTVARKAPLKLIEFYENRLSFQED